MLFLSTVTIDITRAGSTTLNCTDNISVNLLKKNYITKVVKCSLSDDYVRKNNKRNSETLLKFLCQKNWKFFYTYRPNLDSLSNVLITSFVNLINRY